VVSIPGTVAFRIQDFVDAAPETAPPSSVLIVDGDPAERLALRSMLLPLGHPIVEAESDRDARLRVGAQEFAVILLDLRTPTTDGFATAAFIRSREQSKLTPLIFITTTDRAEREMALGFAMGAVDFIVAPIVPAALRGKVSLFADLFEKTLELVEHAQRFRLAATRAAEAAGLEREMLDRMEELARAKSDFVSTISHELRTPLTSVMGYVELLLDGGPGVPTSEQSRMLAIIDRNARRLLTLIGDLLTMSRVDAGIFALQIGPVNLADLVERVREVTAPAVSAAGLELTIDLGGASDLLGDREQLERSILNLVSNAVKFSSFGGIVEIVTRTDGDDVAISVRDTGSGIPADEQALLFTRFFRASRSLEQQVPGTGLGLYIVNQIIELHGGAVDVSSSPAGSTFTMRIPIAGPPADPLALVRGR
jgi:signal transduction histidine kinase